MNPPVATTNYIMRIIGVDASGPTTPTRLPARETAATHLDHAELPASFVHERRPLRSQSCTADGGTLTAYMLSPVPVPVPMPAPARRRRRCS